MSLEKLKQKHIIGFLFVYYVFIICIAPKVGYRSDLWEASNWAENFVTKGIFNAYKNTYVNHFPLSLYIYYCYGLLANFLRFKVYEAVFFFKYLNFLFDIFTFYIIIKIIQDFKLPFIKIALFIFNIALIYIAIFWGENDSQYTFFALTAVYYALKKKPLISFLFLLASLNCKPQAIIFVPLVGLLLFPSFWKDKMLFFKAFLLGIGTELLIFLPFIIHGTMKDFFHMFGQIAGYYPKLSLNAFNFWVLIVGYAHIQQSDMHLWLGLSYRLWGIALFCVSSLVLLAPVLLRLRYWFNNAPTKKEWQLVFLSIALVCIAFFFFMTQMHERYIYPALVFFGLFSLFAEKYFLYFCLSVAALANMMYVVDLLAIHPNAVLRPQFIALLYFFVLIIGMIQLYALFFALKGDTKKIAKSAV